MKLYKDYRNIIDRLKPVELAWFTTFNLESELVERYLLSIVGDKDPGELRTLEDWETLNNELQNKNIKVWYDYRALSYKSEKRSSADFIPVDPKQLHNSERTDSVFHPKVIFIKGRNSDAYLITGSANLSVAAWSSNCESVRIKKVDTLYNASQILDFFEKLGEDVSGLRKWAAKLKKDKSKWDFVYSLDNKWCLMDYLKGIDEELTVWAPYFSKNTSDLIEKISRYGCPQINLVPDISESGKIRIMPEELQKIQENSSVRIFGIRNADERFFHAKVWMTPKTLAVGSWNFSYRATGIAVSDDEKNIEAGIIEKINSTEFMELFSGLTPSKNNVRGTDAEELEKEWEEALLPFSYSCVISADWLDFTYHLEKGKMNEKYLIVLPHSTNERYLLSNVEGMSFKERHADLLINRSFAVYDDNGKEVYQGYLIEKNKDKRPVYGYLSLLDLFESLSYNPLGETPQKHTKGRVGSEEGTEKEVKPSLEYAGTESYYLMFVSFQKLFDSIEEAGRINNDYELDKIGFRLPGSLINICGLVNESIATSLKEPNQDSMLFHWFLAQEVKRCLACFRKYSGQDAGQVDESQLEKKLGFRKRDKYFIRKLKRQFYNVRA